MRDPGVSDNFQLLNRAKFRYSRGWWDEGSFIFIYIYTRLAESEISWCIKQPRKIRCSAVQDEEKKIYESKKVRIARRRRGGGLLLYLFSRASLSLIALVDHSSESWTLFSLASGIASSMQSFLWSCAAFYKWFKERRVALLPYI